jgi:hypothetical protein
MPHQENASQASTANQDRNNATLADSSGRLPRRGGKEAAFRTTSGGT